MPQQPQLLRDGGGFHPDSGRELVDCRGSQSQPAEDPYAAGGGKRLHRMCNRRSKVRVELVSPAEMAAGHACALYLHDSSSVQVLNDDRVPTEQLARRATAISGSHLTLTSSGVRSSALRANILPATLNTECSGPNGKSSIAPACARQHARNAVA